MLDPVVGPEEIMSREVELGCENLTFLLQVVTRQRCNGHCPCDSALAQQLKQQLRSTLVAAQWRGDTALTLPFLWRRSTASSVFRVGARRRAFTLSSPPPSPLPPPNIFNINTSFSFETPLWNSCLLISVKLIPQTL